MTAESTALVKAPARLEMPQLAVRLDAALMAAWEEAQEWARGPAKIQICVRDFLRGMVHCRDTWQHLESEFRVDRQTALRIVARNEETGKRIGSANPKPSDKLSKLLLLSAVRALDSGSAEVTTHHVVEALCVMPDEEQLAEMFPRYVEARSERELEDRRTSAERSVFFTLAQELPQKLEELRSELRQVREGSLTAAERQAYAGHFHAIQYGLQQLKTTVMDAPGLDVRVDKLRESFGNLHDRLTLISEQCSELARSVGEQRTSTEANLRALSSGVQRTESLAAKNEELAHKLDELAKPWWGRLRSARGTG